MMKQKCSYVTPETSVVGVETTDNTMLTVSNGSAGAGNSDQRGDAESNAKQNNLWEAEDCYGDKENDYSTITK